MKNIKLSMIFALALSAGMIALQSCSQNVAEGGEMAKGFMLSDTMMQRIAIDTARHLPVRDVLTLTGKVAIDQSKRADVYPTFGGQVVGIFGELGDHIRKGDPLAIVHSGEATDYNRQLADAQSDIDVAQKTLSVQKDMAKNNLSTDREVLSAQKEYEKAVGKLRTLKATAGIYNITGKGEYVLKAPISGFIIGKNISRDMVLRPDRSDPVFTISEISNVWVIVNVYETDIARINVGMDAEITTLSYPDKVFHGKVDRIFNSIDPQTRAMQVRITLANPGLALKPEMFANVKLIRQEQRSMTAIPSESIIFDKSKHFVMVFHGRNNIETRPVTILKTVDGVAYIAEGLKDGERIISKNQLFIYDELND